MQIENGQILHESLHKQRSEEVTHIVEHMPTKFGSVVTIVVLSLVGLILLFGWLVKYPDVLKGDIILTNRQAPVKLISNTAGILQLYTDTGKIVAQNDYLAVIKNPASIQDVQKIDSLLKKVDIHHVNYEGHRHFFPEDISVGELNQDYFGFLSALYQYLDYYHEESFEAKQDILQKQLGTQKTLLLNATNNYSTEYQKYKLNEGFYKRDSILYHEHVISADELEKAKLSLVSSKQQFEALEKDVANNKYQMQSIENQMRQTGIDNMDKQHDLEITMYNKYFQLTDNIRSWEHKYVFISPFAGRVEFLNFWKNNDYIESGKEAFSIAPLEQNVIGEVLLPEQGAGKVKIGQEVIVKLDDYPYTQFGSVKGKVTNISLVTNQQTNSNNQKVNNYLVTVSLPNNLQTNYGTSLDFHYQAKGTAEIVADKRRLIERLFDNLKHSMK